ncbi:tRNA pseudouridine(55) synthase TruB [bacterium]|nr:tRNA pseudouridine(55) synthase TruB [bacterium]
MARRRKGRRLDGVLLLDKPKGISSNGALQAAKRLLFAQKAGHTGSLDPLASGLLPLCFGEATKLSGYLLDSDKTYWVRARLGQQTSTGDAEGEVVAESDSSQADLASVVEQFLGPVEQIPPMYSAVKHEGKRLYALAREGVEVERKPRTITIHSLDIHGRQQDAAGDHLEFSVKCSKGTYVRTLVEDMALAAGTHGHVAELRRTAVGPYGSEMITLEQLEALTQVPQGADHLLLPTKTAVDHLPRVEMDKDSVFYLRQGQGIQVPKAPTSGLVAVFSEDDALVAIGEIMDDGRIGPKRVLKKPAE